MLRLLIHARNLTLLPALGILLTAAVTVHTQFQIKSWTTDDGLPQNTVHSIVQARDGYLWLATLDGLVRFDGIKFTIFNKQNTPGIVSNRFTRIIEDGNGDLWVGTEESGITRYRSGKFQTFLVAGNAQSQPIWKMALNPSGRVAVSTEAAMLEWDGEEFVERPPISGEKENSQMFWDKSGAFYYLNDNSVRRVKDDSIRDFAVKENQQDAARNPFYEDRRGRVWIGTMGAGLLKLENDELTVFGEQDGLPEGNNIPRTDDRDGNLWIATNEGAFVIAADGAVSRVTAENGLSDNVLSMIHEDREGGIWIGTFYRGLNRLSKNTVAFYSASDGLAANVVHPIFQDRTGDVWLGGGGLTRLKDNRFSRFTGGEKSFSAVVTAIAQDRAGRLWFGHWSGAYYLEDGKLNNFTERFGQTPAIADIHEDRRGALWFATNAGLFRYQNDVVAHLTTADNLVSDNVKVIHESGDGTLWIGTYGGLSKYRDGAFQSFTVADGLSGSLIRALYEDADGTLWLGTYDSGLTRLKDGKFTGYTSRDGLFNDGVFQILEDGGNLWMSSNRGIYRVAKKQLNDFADGKITRIESIAYGKADGLLETECNGGQQPAGIKARDGKLWFPTQRGAAVIDPKRITINPLAPPVVIESVKIDNETIPFSEAINIEPGKNNLEINYTGLSFVKPELVSFRYKLAGLDNDWVEAGTRRAAYYSYLPPGEYDFQVIAANSDGVWNTDGKRLKILVESPFYRTRWF